MPTKLGQNFLVNKDVVKKIIKTAGLTPDDFVLEIGPGKGILTEELAKHEGKVIAVEIDKKLVNLLRNKLHNCKNVEIVKGDILKINLTKQLTTNYLQRINYKVIANLPYYITSPIIRLFLEADNPPSEMILMVQKEVAERIVAQPGKMSILSVAVQYYAKPELLFTVGRENFDPVPEVDSAVIKISNIKNQISKLESKEFFRIVRAGFCAKRKTLANNLTNSFHLGKYEVEEKIKKTGFLPNVRAQELSVENWKKLAGLF
ncbi:MAG: 16S rRNA (adenine(1518)-N(6)/adenine(1519)-N(6))-dimethyltransferase RsmA [Candidatus Moranbacteria bacterium]|nr:16S rRNA (adenine(1518)-N(6)/adenine(1519)-N(6))-dimethyltransferase RsmA [Candidatus Moranbacteria bacterium]